MTIKESPTLLSKAGHETSKNLMEVIID